MRSLLASVPRSLRSALALALVVWTMGATIAVAGPTVSGFVEAKIVNSREAHVASGMSTTIILTNSVQIPFTVPAGKRLVIENVSAEVAVSPGVTPVSTTLHLTLNGQVSVHWLVPTNTGTLGLTRWVVSESVILYADPGSAFLHVVFDSPPDNVIGQVSVSGYLN